MPNTTLAMYTTALLCCLGVSLRAQLVVRVESRGVGVAAAEVSAWSAASQLAASRTDASGVARLPAVPGGLRGAFILVRRLGFVPARIELSDGDSISVELTAVATKLPVLAVQLKTLSCPATADPVADSLWSAAASRYQEGATKLYYSWRGTAFEESVSSERRGYGDETMTGSRQHGVFWPSVHPNAWLVLRDPPPYALFERKMTLVGEQSRWRYSRLESEAVSHFASPRFAENHTLVILGHSADATVVGFCPRSDSTADIAGELLIGADGWLRAARWNFRLPHDDEDAGGEATFGIAVLDGGQYLVSIRGSSWRRAGRGVYNQERFERIVWRIGRTARDVEF